MGVVYSHGAGELWLIIKLNYPHLSDSLQLLLRVDLNKQTDGNVIINSSDSRTQGHQQGIIPFCFNSQESKKYDSEISLA